MAKNLTDRQAAFVRHYVGTARFNGAEAARAAGYAPKYADRQAYQLLENPRVRAAIEEALAGERATEAETLYRTTARARGTFAPFLRVDEAGGVVLTLAGEEAEAHYHLLKRVKQRRTETTKDGVTRVEIVTEIELHDSQRADELILRYYQGAGAASKGEAPAVPALPPVRIILPDNGR